jgi:hypothetical protein
MFNDTDRTLDGVKRINIIDWLLEKIYI